MDLGCVFEDATKPLERGTQLRYCPDWFAPVRSDVVPKILVSSYLVVG